MSGGQKVRIKECNKASKTKAAPRKANNKAFPPKNKIAAVCVKLFNKVIPKSKVLKDKSRSEDSPPEDEDLNGEGCVLAQNLTPEGESTKRPIKINIGGIKAQPKRWKMMAKMRSRRHALDWWKCYLDSCASYHTFFVREFLKNVEEDGSTINGNCNAGSVLLKEKGWYKNFQVWLNKRGIVNLLSIPMLEEA